METRTLKLLVTSAKGLKKVKRLSKMDIFVAVKLSGDPKYSDEQRTQVARDSGTSPKWNNDVLKFSIDQTLAEANRLVITFKIKCEQRGGDNKDIGEVHIPVKELIDHLGNDKTGQRYVTYKIKKPNGKPRGDISFTYSFGDPVVVTRGEVCSRYIAHEPVHPGPAATMYIAHEPVLPGPSATTYHPVTNGPVLSQLLPSVGSFSYNHGPSQPQQQTYPPVAQPEILPPMIFPGLYPPHNHMHGYTTDQSLPTMYPPMFPGLLFPPEGYPTAAPQQTPPGLYPPTSSYGF